MSDEPNKHELASEVDTDGLTGESLPESDLDKTVGGLILER
jgi:hypothetical protein